MVSVGRMHKHVHIEITNKNKLRKREWIHSVKDIKQCVKQSNRRGWRAVEHTKIQIFCLTRLIEMRMSSRFCGPAWITVNEILVFIHSNTPPPSLFRSNLTVTKSGNMNSSGAMLLSSYDSTLKTMSGSCTKTDTAKRSSFLENASSILIQNREITKIRSTHQQQ